MLKENLYCIPVQGEDLSKKAIAHFIYTARENFCGDLLPKGDTTGKPIVIVPEVNLNEDVNRNFDDIGSSAIFGSTIMRNLTDLYIELGGNCRYNCKDCHAVYKQMEWCYSTESVMSIENVRKTIEGIKYANAFDIHLMGGDLLGYPNWDELMLLISSYQDNFKFKINFHLNSKHLLDTQYKPKIHELLTISNIRLMIHIEASDLCPALGESIQRIKEKAEFTVKISDDEELKAISTAFHEWNADIRFLPFYTGENLSFFEKYVFQDQEDILNTSLSKKEILGRQLVNSNHFGKLYIKANGDVCSHINGEPIGRQGDRIQKFVHTEMKNGTFWRKTRDQVEPCHTCLFKYLCPSPSNYEEVVGKFDFCHL